MTKLFFIVLSLCILNSCGGTQRKSTLADIDINNDTSMQGQVFVKPKSDKEIKDAYYTYIKNAEKTDRSRLTAINRLAQLELELSDQLLKDSKSNQTNEELEDSVYTNTLQTTANLLSTALNDFPEAKDNDLSLYQLARTYDQLGQHHAAMTALQQLVRKYPKSPYYAEAQFRLAETAFVTRDYITAEDAYTEVILTPTSDLFYEKAVFKRGWSRYKQQLYFEAVDDYLDALTYHNFDEQKYFNASEKDRFEEYFRAIGLAFSYLDGAKSLQTYFADKPNFKYLYHTYAVIADIYLKKERYSDAANTLVQFSQNHTSAPEVPHSQLKIIEIWQEGGFTQNLYTAINQFYIDYNPEAKYWENNTAEDTFNIATTKLREYIVLVSSYYHNLYQKKGRPQDLQTTQTWYQRYLQHYGAYANKDNIHSLYAELLAEAGDTNQAIRYFESAAYDGQLILSKKAAYATILLSDDLYKSSKTTEEREAWLNKHLNYAYLYAQLYPADKHTNKIALNAAQLSFLHKKYKQALELANQVSDNAPADIRYDFYTIQARAYIELAQYSDAEAIYMELLSSKQLTKAQRDGFSDTLSLSIYRQGEAAKINDDIDSALFHYARISEAKPLSKIASTGLFDAISVAMQSSRWNEAIVYIKRFEDLYPNNKHRQEVSRQLSVAYLNSNQNDKAAQEFERIARSDDSREVQMAALWQAAELYENKSDHKGAIRSYREYAHNYPTPFPQHMEAMFKLTQLYTQTGNRENTHFWKQKIRSANNRATKRIKNDRTNYIASSAILDLAREERREFNRISLVEPLEKNLKLKKSAMQNSIKLYGQASAFGLTDITTESTFSIGDIYQQFSQNLLNSERPNGLNEEELEQYEILLEDQAFPFEEKAIEFYETNLGRVKQGTYNEWIAGSFSKLVELFPVRFARKGKLGSYIGETLQ